MVVKFSVVKVDICGHDGVVVILIMVVKTYNCNTG